MSQTHMVHLSEGTGLPSALLQEGTCVGTPNQDIKLCVQARFTLFFLYSFKYSGNGMPVL